ncbi:MAG TPA: AIPR family protein [Solirubrobacterales bacterium]|nr:AIPR family protein [Solirubrobacterales bacterium]
MSSSNPPVTLTAPYARRVPDPILRHAERHILFVRALDVPDDLPKDPNPRQQKIDRLIYKDIAKHLRNEEGTPNTFHLKNKGITLIADEVRRSPHGKDVYEISFGESHGIVDGGHTYEILRHNREEIEELNARDGDEPEVEQFVKLEIITGLSPDLVPEIARGLNTAVQVQEMSLANLQDRFNWIKETIADEPYADKIVFRENEQDSNKPYDARDLLVILDLFNISDFPNNEGDYPLRAFSSKSKVLQNYLEDCKKGGAKYKMLQPILKDILVLHDTISFEAGKLHNKAGGKAGKLAYVESHKRGKFPFPFIGKEDQYRLFKGALFPMLGAFRWMVEQRTDGQAQWVGGFDEVLGMWREIGAELMKATQETSEERDRNPNAIGKSRNHWATLHSTVAKYQLISSR